MRSEPDLTRMRILDCYNQSRQRVEYASYPHVRPHGSNRDRVNPSRLSRRRPRMLTHQANKRAADREVPEYDAYSLSEIAEDSDGVEPSDQLAITPEHHCRSLRSSLRCGGHSR